MKKNRIFFILLFLPFMANSFAEEKDQTYFLPQTNHSLEVEKIEGGKESYFLPGYSSEENQMEDDENSILYLLPASGAKMDPEIKEDKTFIVNPTPSDKPEFSVGNLEDEKISQLPAGSKALEKSEFESMDNMERLNSQREKAKNALTFSVLLDNYNYGGPPGVYDQLFDSPNSNYINKFFFQGSYQLTFLKKFILLSSGLNAGVSYKTGKGTFNNGQVSNTTFILWAIPVDIPLTLQIPVSSILRVEASAGPSLMTLLQNRNDRSQGESGKDIYQLSPGYFAGGRLKLNWGNIWKSSALALFNSSDVTNLFLNFDARYEFYDKFSEKSVKVEGTSYGIGLSFEFL